MGSKGAFPRNSGTSAIDSIQEREDDSLLLIFYGLYSLYASICCHLSIICWLATSTTLPSAHSTKLVPPFCVGFTLWRAGCLALSAWASVVSVAEMQWLRGALVAVFGVWVGVLWVFWWLGTF